VSRLLEDPRVHVWVRRAQAVGMGALCFLTGTLLVAWLQSSRSIGGGALAVGATAAVVLGGIVAWRRWSPDTVALLGLAMAWLLAAATGVLT
jgi:hypothetical protein